MDHDQNHDSDTEDLTPEGEEPTFDFDELAEEMPGETPLDGVEEPDAAGELANLREQVADLDGRLKRTAADYQNYVRRSAREVLSAREQGKAELVRALITSLDHLDRAVAVDAASTTAAEVQRGVSSTIEELGKAMAAAGVTKLTPAPGDEFDPNIHEALMHTPAEGVESGKVAATLMPGYLVGEVPVRPAQVSVAQ
ncbi:nucleotide exchange factor GrpE [Phycisphaera mikurensis]|uniref:Protein GrpE n=1 Tax=Phycisphaera mikurensis (strain NBRC 102666 / KCTC 22515 / FYK2301M01) TaxID=1142394 RepID=I0IFV7_PHYMF|nr:nucleotide exchange factor GrpE [Phycisphaera mikurensis]MBB6440466.1 molecular chaperone GrpE [Phycisphaera mikurensis]BAM04145.1 protein GrpE [Phycisphaera mikurensis NBRC 102666]